MACEKDQLEVSRNIEISFSFSPQNTSVFVTNGTLIFDKFSFSGDREEGDEVEIEDEFENEILITLPSGKLNRSIQYDIPQGLYTDAEVELRFNSDVDNTPTLALEGTLKDSQGISHSFIFEILDDDIEFETDIEGNAGNGKVSVANGSGPILITFDMNDWFSSLSPSIIDQLQHSSNGSYDIYLNKDNNSKTFEILLADIISNPIITLQ